MPNKPKFIYKVSRSLPQSRNYLTSTDPTIDTVRHKRKLMGIFLPSRNKVSIEQLSLLIFDQKVEISFFETGRRLIKGMGWQAVIVPAMAYDPLEDIFLLEEENLEYLFSNFFNYDRQRKIVLSMVAHELRHRVQHQIPETILWTEDDPLLKDRKDVQEKAKKFKKYLQQYYPREALSIELDARIISYLVASEANESLEHIADLIHYGPLVFQSFPDWLYFL